MNKEKLEQLRKVFKKGLKIELLEMIDPQGVPSGTIGTVQGVDDIGNVLMTWETGSSLHLLPEVDKFRILE